MTKGKEGLDLYNKLIKGVRELTSGMAEHMEYLKTPEGRAKHNREMHHYYMQGYYDKSSEYIAIRKLIKKEKKFFNKKGARKRIKNLKWYAEFTRAQALGCKEQADKCKEG